VNYERKKKGPVLSRCFKKTYHFFIFVILTFYATDFKILSLAHSVGNDKVRSCLRHSVKTCQTLQTFAVFVIRVRQRLSMLNVLCGRHTSYITRLARLSVCHFVPHGLL